VFPSFRARAVALHPHSSKVSSCPPSWLAPGYLRNLSHTFKHTFNLPVSTMTARLSQLLVLAAIFAVAPVTAAAAATADPVESNVDSASDAASANERNLQFGNSPSGSCEAIYMRAFSSESAGFFENLCTLSGLVAYKLGDVNTISSNRVVSMATGSGLTSALSFRKAEFTTDLGTLGFANLANYCKCKALQAGCDPIADCVRGGTDDGTENAGLNGRNWGRDLHKQNLEYIRNTFSRTGAGTNIDTTRQARALLDYTRGIPTDKCLSLCTDTATPASF